MSTNINAARWQSNPVIEDGRINQLRNEIDTLDADIARLLAQRFSVVQKIGDLKNEAKLPVLDNIREAEVLKKAISAATNPPAQESMEAIFRVIMEQSRRLQTKPKLESGRLVFPTVLVIGVGLIGGTLIRQIKRLQPGTKILGCDEAVKLLPAFEEGLIDNGDSNFANLIGDASLIVLASSPETNVSLLKKISPFLKRGQVVIDVTSTKKTICKLAEELNLNGAEFIGGHPFMGSEKQGFADSAEVKADGCVFTLSPTAKVSEVSISRVTRWLSELNFKVQIIPPQIHDAIAARISHIVQILAVALGSSMKDSLTDEEVKAIPGISGKTFRELRRLMNSPASMWFEITQQNADEIISGLNDLSLKLSNIAQAIDAGDEIKLRQHFDRASALPNL